MRCALGSDATPAAIICRARSFYRQLSLCTYTLARMARRQGREETNRSPMQRGRCHHETMMLIKIAGLCDNLKVVQMIEAASTTGSRLLRKEQPSGAGEEPRRCAVGVPAETHLLRVPSLGIGAQRLQGAPGVTSRHPWAAGQRAGQRRCRRRPQVRARWSVVGVLWSASARSHGPAH